MITHTTLKVNSILGLVHFGKNQGKREDMGRYVLNIVILHNSLKNIGLRLSVSICGAIMYGMPWNELGKIISLWNFALDVFISCKKNCSSLLYTFHVLQLHIV